MGNSESSLMLAFAALDGKNYEEAERFFTKVIEEDAKTPQAWIGKGISSGLKETVKLTEPKQDSIQIIDDILSRADGSFKTAERLGGSSEEIISARSRVLDSAIECLNRLADAEITIRLREGGGGLGDQEGTAKLVLKALALKPNDVNAMKMVYKNMAKRGRIEGLLRAYGFNIEELAGKIKAIDTSFVPDHQKEGLCFVATAVYGDFDAPEVRLLRSWRDNVLMNSQSGRLFCQAYYRFGPWLAACVVGNRVLKGVSRSGLDMIVRRVGLSARKS